MKIKLPFVKGTFYLGKDADIARQAYQYGAWFSATSGIDSFFGVRIGFAALYEIYNKVTDVKLSVIKRHKALMREGFRFVNKVNPDADPNPESVAKATALLNRKIMPFRKLKAHWMRDRLVGGNYYLHIQRNLAGEVIGLWPVDPRTMSIVADDRGNVRMYIQRIHGKSELTFEPDEIIHGVWDVNTDNPILGVGPIEAAIIDAKAEIASANRNYMFYENNSVPAHLLIFDEELTANDTKEIKKQIDKKYKGAENSYKAGIIPYLKDVKTIVPSQKDMQYIESRMFGTRKVAVAMETDPFLLGYTEGVQRGNSQEIRKDWYENTIRPDETEFEEMINTFFLPAAQIEDIAFEAIESNYESEEAVYDRTRKDVTTGIITVNEARHVRDLPPSQNQFADDLLVAGTPLDDIGAEFEELKKLHVKKTELEISKLDNLLA